jgi:hypothetical protein
VIFANLLSVSLTRLATSKILDRFCKKQALEIENGFEPTKMLEEQALEIENGPL